MKVLLKIAGSISAYKMCGVVSSLKKRGHVVKVACSPSALKFVGEATWEALSGHPVFSYDFSPKQRMEHIYLNDWADIVVLSPATAKSLNEISQSVGDSVITTLFLARKKNRPYLIFPAMNPRMWKDSSLQTSVQNLKKESQVSVYEPDQGEVACGHVGVGRLRSESFILNEILKHDSKPQSVVVTLGGTSESLDGVREITNFSTGQTGLAICRELSKKFKVYALGPQSVLDSAQGLEGISKIYFKSSASLRLKLFKILEEQNITALIHAAAVSDFIPQSVKKSKISSDENLTLDFVKNEKILTSVREHSKNKNLKLISFKLTHQQTEEVVQDKIKTQFLNSQSDFVVHNELNEISKQHHPFKIYNSDLEIQFAGNLKTEMSHFITQICED